MTASAIDNRLAEQKIEPKLILTYRDALKQLGVRTNYYARLIWTFGNMRYLQRVSELADSRGYYRDGVVLAVQRDVPEWFRTLGTASGLLEFERRRGFHVPLALREFYENVSLASFCEAAVDGEVFLTDLARCIDGEIPPVVTWSGKPYLVYAFHPCSGTVCGAELGSDDPHVLWGFDDEPESPDKRTVLFSEWIFCLVDGLEARLDFWQAACEKCSNDSTEADHFKNLIRHLPGGAERLSRTHG